ncbi:TolC family protein [Permianibacter sp. IMCC34836]|uniref:TolC family protein n=1 Tax=Permianibacter fluminis TaxID=2738515 RepID=UPI00155253D9|nr:TolC family protein [Permianibacter fluminis]NQD37636.1 TolC family protein [Permianibacter fluminis]
MFLFFLRLRRRQSLVLRSWGRFAIASILIGVASLGQAESLPFHDALRLALQDAPLVRASEAQTSAARQAALPAGELPDPKLALGIENLPIEGPDRYSLTADFMTMQRIGLMQEFPNAAKRNARMDAASARIALSKAYEQVAQQTVLRETAQAWLVRHAVEQQLSVLDELVVENRLFDTAIRAQHAGGKAAATDVVMPRQEAAMLAQRRDELMAKRAAAIAQLRRWLGAAADEPLAGDMPDWSISREQLIRRVHQHPELAVFRPKAQILDAEIAEANAAKRPDWALELAYQKRGPDFGDMVMVQVSFDLPFFASSRQEPLIAAKQAEQIALNAESEAFTREHLAMLESELAEYQRLQQSETRFTETLLPLADEKVTLALAGWRAGAGALSDVIAARRERLETRLSAIVATSEREQLAARLHFTYDDLSGEFAGVLP